MATILDPADFLCGNPDGRRAVAFCRWRLTNEHWGPWNPLCRQHITHYDGFVPDFQILYLFPDHHGLKPDDAPADDNE